MEERNQRQEPPHVSVAPVWKRQGICRSMVNTLADRILGSLWKGFLPTPPTSCVASVSSPYFSGTTASPTAYSESPPGHRNCVPIFLCAASPVILLLVKNISTPPGATMGLDTLPEVFTRVFLPLKSYPPFYSPEIHGDSLFFLSKTTILFQVSISLIWLVQSASQSSSQHMPS